jgi:hypothetical protein
VGASGCCPEFLGFGVKLLWGNGLGVSLREQLDNFKVLVNFVSLCEMFPVEFSCSPGGLLAASISFVAVPGMVIALRNQEWIESGSCAA